MTSKTITLRKITFAAVVAAVYAALTFAIAPIAYGPVQFRVTEVLCILPFFFPFSVWGLFVGCIIANLASMYGPADVVFGSLATLLAAVLTMALGRGSAKSTLVKALACLPPVIVNAVVVGALIAFAETQPGGAFWPAFILNGLWVGFGELVVLYALGLPAIMFLPRTAFFKSLNRLYFNN